MQYTPEQMVQQYYSEVFRIALRLLRNRAHAEDATQETMFHLLKRMQQTGPTPFRDDINENIRNAYVHRTVRHIVADIYRESIRHPANSLESYAVAGDGLEYHLSNDSRWTDNEHAYVNAGAVQSACASLPSDQQQAIQMIYRNGMRAKEAAQLLSISERTFKSRLSTARRRIKKILLEPPQTHSPKPSSPLTGTSGWLDGLYAFETSGHGLPADQIGRHFIRDLKEYK